MLTTRPEWIKWWKACEHMEELVTALTNFDVNSDQSVEAMWNVAVRQIHKVAEVTFGRIMPG